MLLQFLRRVRSRRLIPVRFQCQRCGWRGRSYTRGRKSVVCPSCHGTINLPAHAPFRRKARQAAQHS